ncbi:MAG: hypothetical protein JXB23_01690 [Candidatus Aminicenantes bacterium]|nr:hypothetical protein [Candidatus Aminicenantes bacterium]
MTDHKNGQTDPVLNFDSLWRLFDISYGCFIPKKIDWHLLYRTYRPMVTDKTSGGELFNIMTSLLEHLNDNHVKLQSKEPPRFFRSGVLGNLNRDEKGRHIPIGYNIPDFSLELVKQKYLKGKFEQRLPGTKLAAYFGGDFPLYTFAWIAQDIGYLHIRNFDEEEKTAEIMNEIVAEFKDARGLVLDVRGNGGGWDPVAKAIADRFADRKRLFMTTQTRNGPKHDDFAKPRYWYTEPKGPQQFKKPIIMLTHRWTISAGDCFVLAMRVFPHVINLGEFTSGAYSDEYWDKLPNGWDVCICNMLYLDHEERCWEGIGTPPNIRMVNTKEDIAEGRDRVLERAIDLLRAEPKIIFNHRKSIQPRESMAEILEKTIEEKSLEYAIEVFYHKKSSDPKSFYIDIEEMDRLGKRLMKRDKTKEAIEIFKLNTKEHPDDYRVFNSLAQAYDQIGESKSAMEHYMTANKLNPRNLPRERKHFKTAGEYIFKRVN